MIRRPPISTRTDTLFPYTTLFRSPVLGGEGAADYAATFLPRSLGLDVDADWHRQWTIFNWANWFAWAPVTALFLGRLAVGYTVRAFIAVNLLLPALFVAVWLVIIAGTTITTHQIGRTAIRERGWQYV